MLAPIFKELLTVPTVNSRSTALAVLLKATVTFEAEIDAKVFGRVSTGVPEACNWTPPALGNRRINSASTTPTSTSPEVNRALVP